MALSAGQCRPRKSRSSVAPTAPDSPIPSPASPVELVPIRVNSCVLFVLQTFKLFAACDEISGSSFASFCAFSRLRLRIRVHPCASVVRFGCGFPLPCRIPGVFKGFQGFSKVFRHISFRAVFTFVATFSYCAVRSPALPVCSCKNPCSFVSIRGFLASFVSSCAFLWPRFSSPLRSLCVLL